ncbi:MAG: adenosylcobinamide-phosphate synthase CbiB [Dehalococcoidia bacterium]
MVHVPGQRPSSARAATIGIAALLDLAAGEPPAAAHPVVWIGRLVGAATARLPRTKRGGLPAGVALAALVPTVAGSTAVCVTSCGGRFAQPARGIALGLALKPAFAIRALLAAGRELEDRLRAGDLRGARLAARALVSRDPASLDAPLLAAAAIESLSENLTDSVVAPLFWFVLAGLPGAYAYRAINTLDSMIGYRGEYEWLGKASARLDDAANLIPARLTVALLWLAAIGCGLPAGAGSRVARRDHRLAASPNAGWTMAFAAGALDVRLEKRGHYVLNEYGRLPGPDDVRAARRLVAVACGLSVATAWGAAAAWERLRGRP